MWFSVQTFHTQREIQRRDSWSGGAEEEERLVRQGEGDGRKWVEEEETREGKKEVRRKKEGEERGKKGEKETERNDGKVSERRENLRRNRRSERSERLG